MFEYKTEILSLKKEIGKLEEKLIDQKRQGRSLQEVMESADRKEARRKQQYKESALDYYKKIDECEKVLKQKYPQYYKDENGRKLEFPTMERAKQFSLKIVKELEEAIEKLRGEQRSIMCDGRELLHLRNYITRKRAPAVICTNYFRYH